MDVIFNCHLHAGWVGSYVYTAVCFTSPRVREPAAVVVDNSGIIAGVVPVDVEQEGKPPKSDTEELTSQSKQQEAVSQEEPKLPPPPQSEAKTQEEPSIGAQQAEPAPTVPKSDSNQVQTQPVDTVQDKPALVTASEKVEECPKAALPAAPAPEKNSLFKGLGTDSNSQLVVIGKQILPTPPADEQACVPPSGPQPNRPPVQLQAFFFY